MDTKNDGSLLNRKEIAHELGISIKRLSSCECRKRYNVNYITFRLSDLKQLLDECRMNPSKENN